MVDKLDTAAAAKPELFQNHNVVDGKVQKNWSDTFMFRAVDTLQKAYDDKQPNKSEGWSLMTPFNCAGRVITTVYNAIVDAFKAVFSLCFNYPSNEDTAAADATKAKGETKKV